MCNLREISLNSRRTTSHYFLKGLLLSFIFLSQPALAEDTLTFPNACAQGKQITIAAMGDLLLHRPLQLKASQSGYESLWEKVTPFLKSADIVYANLEGPIAPGISRNGSQVNDPLKWDLNVYSDFPVFNYHPSLAQSLKTSGFTIVSTANNHALDRSSIGIDKTIETLDKAGLHHVGTRSKSTDQPWFKTLESQGFKIAWLACTEHTNGINDKHHQILHCNRTEDRQVILKTIQELKSQVDAIVVLPHWGEEYHEYPTKTQTAFATQVLDAGATAVIGSHPHVLQPVKKYITKDNRATLISYSLGNFVSFQGSPRTRSTMILLLGLTKTANGTIINGVRFVPLFMQNRSGTANIHITPLSPQNRDWVSYQIISRNIPSGNALFSPKIITNPECFK